MSQIVRHESCHCNGTKVGKRESLVNCPDCGKLQTTSGRKKFECCGSRHLIRGRVHGHEDSRPQIVLNINLLSVTGISVKNYSFLF